jgi:hypothetical protein
VKKSIKEDFNLKAMLRARNYWSNIRRCPLMNCLYNLKKHLRSNRHKINNEDVVNRILEMVRSNSLPEETLLRVQNDNIVQVTVGSQLERTASTIPTAMQSAQEQNASGSEVLQSSTATHNSRNPTADDGELLCDQRQIQPATATYTTTSKSESTARR